MTQGEKQLLFKDLCARLPYRVKINIYNDYTQTREVVVMNALHLDRISYNLEHGGMRPYLRPISSMTEEEFKEYEKENDIDTADSSETLRENLKAKARVRVSKWYHGSDWLDAHHFDYRGLIPMGLALEALEGMYMVNN